VTRHPDTGKHVEADRRIAASIIYWLNRGKTDTEAVALALAKEPPGAERYKESALALARQSIRNSVKLNSAEPSKNIKDVIGG